MFKKLASVLLTFVLGIAIIDCTQPKTSGLTEARQYCSSCHLFPEPSLLDKATWKKKVLPAMGRLLEAEQSEDNPFAESDRIIAHEQFKVPAKVWEKIVDFYIAESPQELPKQTRPNIQKITTRFNIEIKPFNESPSNTFLKIDAENKWIYAGTRDSLIITFDSHLNIISKQLIDGVVVDLFLHESLKGQATKDGVMTTIGIMDPNDFKTGSASIFSINKFAQFKSKQIFDTLPRPVQIIPHDLNVDGKTDYLICGFGNKEGAFFWMQNKGGGQFDKKMLRPLAGAIKAYITDFNRDGLPDIIALFAQAREGIYLFTNKGNGVFDTKEIMHFPPVYGSTFFEMIDFNGDGILDIVYTCGDNADYSPILKNYHGIYIFINKGNYTFEQQYFFPLHGAFKALARDFDKDGDLDIAAISYFPDTKNQPQEAFVFLENSNRLTFIPHLIKEYNQGHWITMDAGDIDKDGDEDIVIGSLYLPNEILKMKNQERPLFLLLRNNTIK